MNNINLNDPIVAAYIAANAGKIAALQRAAGVADMVKDDLAVLANADEAGRTAKNVADAFTTVKASIWESVKNVVKVVSENAPADETEQLYIDVMGAVLSPATGPDGKAMKLSTAGQYASTGKKMLTQLLAKGVQFDMVADKTRSEVMAMFKSAEEQLRLQDMEKAPSQLRYIAKHGTDAQWNEVKAALAGVLAVYNAVKSVKDGDKNAAPAADNGNAVVATIVETVAGEHADTEQLANAG